MSILENKIIRRVQKRWEKWTESKGSGSINSGVTFIGIQVPFVCFFRGLFKIGTNLGISDQG